MPETGNTPMQRRRAIAEALRAAGPLMSLRTIDPRTVRTVGAEDTPSSAPIRRRKAPSRLQYRLEASRVNDANYLVERLTEIIPDPNVMLAIGLGLQKIAEQRGGTIA